MSEPPKKKRRLSDGERESISALTGAAVPTSLGETEPDVDPDNHPDQPAEAAAPATGLMDLPDELILMITREAGDDDAGLAALAQTNQRLRQMLRDDPSVIAARDTVRRAQAAWHEHETRPQDLPLFQELGQLLGGLTLHQRRQLVEVSLDADTWTDAGRAEIIRGLAGGMGCLGSDQQDRLIDRTSALADEIQRMRAVTALAVAGSALNQDRQNRIARLIRDLPEPRRAEVIVRLAPHLDRSPAYLQEEAVDMAHGLAETTSRDRALNALRARRDQLPKYLRDRLQDHQNPG